MNGSILKKKATNTMASPKNRTNNQSAKTAKSNETTESQNSDFMEAADENEESGSTTFADDFEDMALPEDSSLITGDVEGYWDPTMTAIRCKPISVKLFDGNLDKKKPGILLVCELVLPCKIAYKEPGEEEWSYRRAAAGTMVGVWYKAGMRGIVNKAGVDCYIKLTDKEKDTGKPNPMKIYEVRAGAGGYRVPITEDVRNQSASLATDFDVRRGGAKKQRNVVDDDDSEDFEDFASN